MTQSPPASSVLLPERRIRPPLTVSAAAQVFLGQPGGEAPAYPDIADKAGWRALLQEQERWLVEGMAASAAAFPHARIHPHELAGATLYEIDPGRQSAAPAGKAILLAIPFRWGWTTRLAPIACCWSAMARRTSASAESPPAAAWPRRRS